MKFFANRRTTLQALAATLILGAAAPLALADEAPDAMIQRLSDEVLHTIRADKSLQSGDMSKVMALVESKVMPNVDFRRMTASATGPAWRQATQAQQQQLQSEFKTLLVRTYASALRQVSDQRIEVQPLRAAAAGDQNVVVRTLIRGQGDPVQLDYRLQKTPGDGAGWKIYDMNILGIWLVDTYRPQFAQQINAGGIDKLLNTLSERNKANAG